MDIIYGVSLEYDDMLTILQKVYNEESFDINTGDYKQYTDDLNTYIQNNFEPTHLKIFSTALIEAENSNNFWTIGYHLETIGYYANLCVPKIPEKTKSIIEKNYLTFCKKFNINKSKFDFIIMISDDKLNI